jgi:cytochrome c biogenesis protein CcdA
MARAVQSMEEFTLLAKNDLALQSELQKDPIKTLEMHTSSPLATDKWIYRAVVLILGSSAMFSILGILVVWFYQTLIDSNTQLRVPESLVSFGAMAIGALAGLLAPSPIRR